MKKIVQTSGKVTKFYVLQKCYCYKLMRHEIIFIEVKGDEDAPQSCFTHE